MKKLLTILCLIITVSATAQKNLITNKGEVVPGTAVGINLLGISTPAAARFLRVNSDGTVTPRTAAELLSDIGAQASGSYQPLATNLTDISGLTATTDNFIVSVASAWASRTPAQVKTTLSLNNVTNESKATMFTNATFTGTFTTAAGAIGNASLANSAVANLSGTNTGDQTITLTSDVTGSGTGSFATTIAAGAVTLAKMANVATGTVFYRKTAATGVPEVQTLATLKTDLGLTGTNSGDQTITLTGDITGSGTGSFATTLATVNSNVGTFGGATQSLTATVNGKGLITAISAQTVTPAVGSITGLGTGVATALAVNVGSAGAFITFNGAGGTPSSLTGTNITGTATGLTAGAVNNSLSIAAELISGGATSYNGSAAKSIAIQPASVTNAMLAGSIASSKLVGTDITTIGTITSGGLGTGAVIGGVTITLGSDALYDVYYRGASGILTRLAAGTDGYQLTTHSTSSAPTWEAAGGGGSGLTFAQVSALMVIKY